LSATVLLQVLDADAAGARCYTATESESLRNHSLERTGLAENSRFGTAICAGWRKPPAPACRRHPL